MDNTTTFNGQDLSADDNHADLLTLGLSTFHHHLPPPPTPAPPPPLLINPALSAFHHPLPPPPPAAAISIPSPSAVRPRRQRRNPSRTPSAGKSPTIPPPYPWSTDRRATVHSLDYLISRQISAVSGDVECKRCERRYSVEFDLRQKFAEVGSYVAAHKGGMHQRAPAAWCSPALLRCRFCEQDNSARPVMAEKKRSINWLFLLLGQMLGCCTLDQLKYFCKHTKNHRTGAKDRVLYLAYLALCRQLDPQGPFDI
ncbi:Unknown protein [Striga hermonthica]|uniref:DUF7086 domain-containing protein n=1 Tax=Striga hermonthica TaxID=68872 RepID=A0A9N7N7E5_STRHE|nr:Unknown protein [Striga hermonthica]